MKKAIALLVVLAGLLLADTGEVWPGTYPLPLFNNVLINATGTDTSIEFSVPPTATGFFAIEYAGVSATGTAEYQLYYEVMYPRQTVYTGTHIRPALEVLNWDTVWVTPPLGIIADSTQADTASFEGFPGIRGAVYRIIVLGLSNNPADTRFHARLIADIE